jgi:hypothetical protein
MSEINPEKAVVSEQWLRGETWFMRYSGGMLLLVAVVSVFSGVYPNPGNETILNGFNLVLTLLLFTAGAWVLSVSFNETKMRSTMEDFLAQPAERSTLFAVVQIVVGVLFVLEGLRGRIPLLLLAVLLFSSVGWTFWRGAQIKQHQGDIETGDAS